MLSGAASRPRTRSLARGSSTSITACSARRCWATAGGSSARPVPKMPRLETKSYEGGLVSFRYERGQSQPRYWSSCQDGTGASSSSVRPPSGSA